MCSLHFINPLFSNTNCKSLFFEVSLVCFLVFLLQGRLALLQNRGDKGPGHVGTSQGTTFTTGAEHLIVRALFLDRLC